MTISTEPSQLSYDGDDSTVDFPITWNYFAKSDVVATLRDSSAVETLWVLGTDYSLTDADLGSGTLTATTAPSTGETLIIDLEPPNTQLKDFPIGGKIPTPEIEAGLDLAAQRDAKLESLLNRAILVPTSDIQVGLLVLPIDSLRASKLSAYDENGALTIADFIDNVFLAQEDTPTTDGSILLWLKTSTGILHWLDQTVPSWRGITDTARPPFDTVSEMVSSVELVIGDIVSTAGYNTKGDGGQNQYEIVAAGTGTDDSGSFIDLSTHQAKGLFPGGEHNAVQWGASASIDLGAAINSALAFVDTVRIPAGAFNQTTQANIGGGKHVLGAGIDATIITLTADVTAFQFLKGDYPSLKRLTILQNTTHTLPGIVVGVDTANFVNRPHLDDIYVDGMGSHGIEVAAGVLGTLGHIISLNNGGDGIYLSSASQGSNAWTFSGTCDLRGNTGYGLRIEKNNEGPADTSYDSVAHSGGEIVAQANTAGGVRIETSRNVLIIFTENNTGTNLELTNESNGNTITVVNGGYTDNGTGNIVFSNDIESGRAGVATQLEMWGPNGWKLNTGAGTFTGTCSLEHSANAEFTWSFDNIGAAQTLKIQNDSGANRLNIEMDGYIQTRHLEIADGISAPGATSGFAKLYVDAADGDLKVVFGDGTVKTISTDT